VRRPSAVIDLRAETAPARHRQTRGVPREPDARLRAYRDRPAHPSPNGSAHRVRPIDVLTFPTDRSDGADNHERGLYAGPTSDREHPHGEPQTEMASTDEHGKPMRGRLVVTRLRLRSVAKVALTFYVCLWAVVAVAGTILWHLANREGWVTGWTGFLVDVGFTDAAVDGPTLARASATAGGILVATATLLTVAAAMFYNQLSGLFGGVEVTLTATKRRVRRRDRRRDRRR
jgi:hypothetical protein